MDVGKARRKNWPLHRPWRHMAERNSSTNS